MIALSTVYNISKYKDPVLLVNKIKSLGFCSVELSVEVPEDFINYITGNLKVVSVHNFCPKLDFVPKDRVLCNAYHISAINKEERDKAVELTKKTIDIACNTGANAVVVHSGEVEMELSGGLLAKKYKDTKGSGEYSKTLKMFLRERKIKSKLFLDNVLKSLDEILNYAVKKNVKIGIENRLIADEIPSFEEYAVILGKFDTNYLGLWYDVGHSVVAEKQGIVKNHIDFLRMFSSRLIGMHLHDVSGVRDHKAPGTGEVNFNEISEFIQKETILVAEVYSTATKGELKNSMKYLENCGFCKYSTPGKLSFC
ncbi:MAG: TIM barrel protein [Elusimicrobia bacterium]|nr:TIM barrel protein [Elusimicrobiota bacterium]